MNNRKIGQFRLLLFCSVILSGCLDKLITDAPSQGNDREPITSSSSQERHTGMSSTRQTGTKERQTGTSSTRQTGTIAVYEQIDKHALNTPKAVEQSIASLANYLTKPAKNEREKVRAIYRWITHNIAYDDDSFFSGGFKILNQQDVLKTRRAVCDGYAGLFKRLGQAAGLEVEDISGYSKGYSYSVHQTDSINHAWNAVKIDGQWQLLDATWGAGYLDAKRKRFVRRFQAHYFLTPPEQFIYDHFPKNSKWQLLPSPVSKSEYDQWVYLRPAFFHYGLAIGSHSQGMINTNNQLTVTLRAPADVGLSAKLFRDNRALDRMHTSIQKQAPQQTIHVTFPQPGEYILRVFAKRLEEPGNFRWALDYRIIVSDGMLADKIPVAPEQTFIDAGLKVASHPYRLIETDKQVMVTILAPNNVLMSAKLYKNNKRLDKFLTFTQTKAGQYEIYAIFPNPGDYLFRLLVKPQADANAYYIQALDYQVKVSQGMSGKVGFPNASVLFKENQGYLYTPMHRHLEVGKTQTFKLAVPTAENMIVVVGNQNFPLSKQGNLFEGEIPIDKGKIGVYAKFPDNRRYGNLLQYVAD